MPPEQEGGADGPQEGNVDLEPSAGAGDLPEIESGVTPTLAESSAAQESSAAEPPTEAATTPGEEEASAPAVAEPAPAPDSAPTPAPTPTPAADEPPASPGMSTPDPAPAPVPATADGAADAQQRAPIKALGGRPLWQSAPEVPVVDPAERNKAFEELKAAIERANAAPAAKKPETEALLTLCLCVKDLVQRSPDLQELLQVLPRIGESRLAPLLGLRRSRTANGGADAKASPPLQKVSGRVKSYNTRKGFGFIDVPGYPRDIFVYNSHLIGRVGLIAGEAVEFELVMDSGRPQARQVKVVTGGSKVTAANQQNPLNVVKQAMNTHAPVGSGVTGVDLLAMAAAAAEIPTSLPQQQPLRQTQQQRPPEDFLYDKIREAQSQAATGKRKENAKLYEEGLDEPAKGAGRGTGIGMDASVDDDGPIPKNAIVRVNLPSSEVNDCTAFVQGFDESSGLYNVSVERRKAGGGSEQATMQLERRCLRVEQYPPGSGPSRAPPPQSMSDRPSSQASPPPLPPLAGQSEALRKSASEALRKFGNLALPAQPPQGGRWPGPPVPAMAPDGGKGFGKGPCGPYPGPYEAAGYPHTAGPPMRPGQGGPPFGFNGSPRPGPADGVPHSMGGPGHPGGKGLGGYPARELGSPSPRENRPSGAAEGGPRERRDAGRSPEGTRAIGQAQAGPLRGPATAASGTGPRQVVSLERSVPGLGEKETAGASTSPGPRFAQQPASGSTRPGGSAAAAEVPSNSKPSGFILEHFARKPAVAGPTPGAGGRPGAAATAPGTSEPFLGGPSPPQPSPSSATVQKADAQTVRRPPEGFAGQRWYVCTSKEFVDVIVRESMEVSSKELRRIRPGENCVQRGETVELLNGLVRMPVQPSGWVTVHARNIGGPTFLIEEGSSRSVGSTAPAESQAPAAKPPPRGNFERTDGRSPPRSEPKHPPIGEGRSQDPLRASDPWASMSMTAPRETSTGPTYDRALILGVRSALKKAGALVVPDAPTAGIRRIIIPDVRAAPRRERRERAQEEEDERPVHRSGSTGAPSVPLGRVGPPGNRRTPTRERQAEAPHHSPTLAPQAPEAAVASQPPPGTSTSPGVQRPSQAAAAAAAAAGDEPRPAGEKPKGKQDCPTQ